MTSKEVTMVRVYLTEGDHVSKTQLAKKLLEDLHRSKIIAGATIFRGVAGFGSHFAIHEASILHPEAALPMVIEFFDSADRIAQALDYVNQYSNIRVVTWKATAFNTDDAQGHDE